MTDAVDPVTDSRVLRIIVGSSMLSKVADWQLGILIPLAVLEETDSVALSIITIAMRGVAYVASPLLGAVIDRFDKRTIFALSQLQQVLCLVLLAAFFSNQVVIATLVLLSGAGGVASTITGQFVLIPKLMSEPARPRAVATLNSAIESSKLIGLVLGGAAFSSLGPTVAVLCVAGLYLVAGVVALLLPKVPSGVEKMSIRRDLAIGFRWVVKPEIMWLVLTMSMVNLSIGQLEPVLVTELGQKGLDPRVISGLLAMGMVMGAVASRLAPVILSAWNPERRILASQVVAFAGFSLIMTPELPTKIAGYMLECFAVAVSNVASITYRQTTIPVEFAGRVNATIRMFITGALPLSGFLYAMASGLEGVLFWLPALCIWAVAIAMWILYTYRSEGALAAVGLEGSKSGDH